MKHIRYTLFILPMLAVIATFITLSATFNAVNDNILSYTVDSKKQDIQLYWKNDKGQILNSLQNLKTYVESKNKILLFAMNAGMYQQDYTPLGLFIQQNKIIHSLNKASASGNFYLKPNGVFYLTTDYTAEVCKTEDFVYSNKIQYATQSGPMLLIDGQVHSSFKEGSTNLNIRNGVGILPDGRILFAMSKKEINFYDFAMYFKNMGCKNALYLDGFVSRTYFPEQNWKQLDGTFGVMIGVTK